MRKESLNIVQNLSETNIYGKEITVPYQLSSAAFGTGRVDRFGIPEVDWVKCRTEYADVNGFDTRNEECNGKYIINYTIPKNTIIIRFGSEYGRFTAPQNTRFEEVSLPYTVESLAYHEYRVIADSLTVKCIVDKGRVAPMFNQIGGGIQYLHNRTIHSLLRSSVLERIK